MDRNRERKPRAILGVLRPHAAVVYAQNHFADGEAKPSARPVLPPAIRGIFFKNVFQQIPWNQWAGSANVDAIRIWLRGVRLAPFHRRRLGDAHASTLPKERVASNLDRALLRSKLASVIEKIDQHLLDLTRL